jgi:aspartyl-tRNA(Asn)/glutamyl-tRNA(Gln) amidotransferase subunit C
MALERSDVEKIAHLARLGLNEADLPQHHRSPEQHFRAGRPDAGGRTPTGIEPLAHPLEASQRLRADVVTETQSSRGLPVHRASGRKRPLPGSQGHRVKGKSLQCIK